LTGQCKFDGICFLFSSHRKKKEETTPTHIVANLQATQTDAQNQDCKRAKILPLQPRQIVC